MLKNGINGMWVGTWNGTYSSIFMGKPKREHINIFILEADMVLAGDHHSTTTFHCFIIRLKIFLGAHNVTGSEFQDFTRPNGVTKKQSWNPVKSLSFPSKFETWLHIRVLSFHICLSFLLLFWVFGSNAFSKTNKKVIKGLQLPWPGQNFETHPLLSLSCTLLLLPSRLGTILRVLDCSNVWTWHVDLYVCYLLLIIDSIGTNSREHGVASATSLAMAMYHYRDIEYDSDNCPLEWRYKS